MLFSQVIIMVIFLDVCFYVAPPPPPCHILSQFSNPLPPPKVQTSFMHAPLSILNKSLNQLEALHRLLPWPCSLVSRNRQCNWDDP